jgi:hypothetical protein
MLAFPLQAFSNDWSKYLNATDRFYNLDKQEFNNISCNIEVPVTTNLVKQLREQFEPMKDKIEIKENLADFRLTYIKNSGLNISYPSFDIRIISEEGMADPAKVKKGIEQVKAGFKQQIEGYAMQLQGLLEGFDAPKKSKYKIKEIKDGETSYTAVYEKDGSNITETYSHNRRKVKQISKSGDEISSTENYKNIANNKLLLTDAQANIKNAMGIMEMNVTISYEKIKDVIFPTHIDGRFRQSMQTIKQEGQFDIYLKNCTLR